MHLALKAYQELLATVNEMDMSPDEAVRESSRIIKSKTLAWSLIPASPSLDQHHTLPSLDFNQILCPNFPDQCFQSFLFHISRQYFLCDGVSRTIPGAVSKVWREMPAPLFPSWPGGDHPPLPQDVGAVLSEPGEHGGAGAGQIQDMERAGREGWRTRALSLPIFYSFSWYVRTALN